MTFHFKQKFIKDFQWMLGGKNSYRENHVSKNVICRKKRIFCRMKKIVMLEEQIFATTFMYG